MTQTLTLIRPDDWHLHLRDGEVLHGTVPTTAEAFSRAIIMPNLASPIVNLEQAQGYRERILSHVPTGVAFDPLMVLYLTDNTTVADIKEAAASGIVYGAKLYPAGATTNSNSGVTDPSKIFPLYEALEESGIPLLLHGEVTDDHVDIFDREKYFIERHLGVIRKQFPALKIVFEHVTTKEGVDFVKANGVLTAATVTPQHLMLNRNDLLVGGVRPHHYCLPILKRREHQEAIQAAVLEGHPQFFLGTDSAPHARTAKEAACGCAGCYSAPAALPLYAHFFDTHNALDKLEAFASQYGPAFYGLPENSESITLVKESWKIPTAQHIAGIEFSPWLGGETIHWRLAH